MTKKMAKGLAFAAVLALLCACVCGAFSVAADDEEGDQWQITEDGQLLYAPYQYRGQDGVKVVYIGDGDDVTVPAAFGGQPAGLVWFTDEALDLQFDSSEQAQTWRAKAGASARRYLNVTFEEGPTTVWVQPVMWPDFRLVHSVTLPRSATEARLIVAGAATISVPAESQLSIINVEPALENVPDPEPTVIDLTGAAELKQVIIGRNDYWGDCFLEGSVLKLPIEFKDVPIVQSHPANAEDASYCFIDGDYPMPLTVQYADGTEAAVPETSSEEPSEEPSDTSACSEASDIADPSDVSDVALLGDADGDGDVTMKDILQVRKAIAGLENNIDEQAADFNRDGNVDMKDVLLARKFIASK